MDVVGAGTLVVARDIAHAKLLERIESGKGKPPHQYRAETWSIIHCTSNVIF